MMFSLVSRKFLAMRNIALYSVYLLLRYENTKSKKKMGKVFTRVAKKKILQLRIGKQKCMLTLV